MSVEKLINQLSKYSDPISRLNLHDDIFRELRKRDFPFGKVTESFSAPSVGAYIAIQVDNTNWMAPGQRLMLNYLSDDTPHGGYFEVSSVGDSTTVTLKLIETFAISPGDVIPVDAFIVIGVPPGDKYAFTQSSVGIGWLKNTDGSWTPEAETTDILFKFSDRQVVRQRTVSATLDTNAGTISVDTFDETVDGITLTVLNDGTEAPTLRFIDVATGVVEERTLMAIDGNGSDGADGAPGAQGPEGPIGVFHGYWQASEDYIATSSLKAVVVHDGKYYISKLASGPSTVGARQPVGSSDQYWEYITSGFTGLTILGADGSKLALSDDGIVQVRGEFAGAVRVENRPESRMALGALDTEVEPPLVSHDSQALYDQAHIVSLFSPSGGSLWVTTDGTEPDAADLWNPNLLLQSNTFNNVAWTLVTGTSVTPNGEAGPDGTVSTADRLNGTTGVILEQALQKSEAPCTIVKGHFLTLSCWMRGWATSVSMVEETAFMQITEYNGGTPLTITLKEFPVNPVNWRRYALIHEIQNADCDEVRVRLGGSWAASSSMAIYGAQLELGWHATPYQESTTARGGIIPFTMISGISPYELRAKAVKYGVESFETKRTWVSEAAAATPPVILPIDWKTRKGTFTVELLNTASIVNKTAYATGGDVAGSPGGTNLPGSFGTLYSEPFEITVPDQGQLVVRAASQAGSGDIITPHTNKVFIHEPFEK